jgi:hypothetical protein
MTQIKADRVGFRSQYPVDMGVPPPPIEVLKSSKEACEVGLGFEVRTIQCKKPGELRRASVVVSLFLQGIFGGERKAVRELTAIELSAVCSIFAYSSILPDGRGCLCHRFFSLE